MTIEFRILGGLEVLVDGEDHAPSAPKVRQLLSLLLVRAGRDVPSENIIAELWDEAPPASANTTTQTYIYQLRKLFEENDVTGVHGPALTTRGTCYRLDIDPESVDEHRFRTRIEQGRKLLAAQQPEQASEVLTGALLSWGGAPFSGVEHGRLLEAHAVNLDELRNRALEMRVEAEMSLGHHHELIAELRMLCAEQPLNEWMHGKLIQALGLAGRRSDAIAMYEQICHLLDTELGLRPSAATRQLQEQMLNA